MNIKPHCGKPKTQSLLHANKAGSYMCWRHQLMSTEWLLMIYGVYQRAIKAHSHLTVQVWGIWYRWVKQRSSSQNWRTFISGTWLVWLHSITCSCFQSLNTAVTGQPYDSQNFLTKTNLILKYINVTKWVSSCVTNNTLTPAKYVVKGHVTRVYR